MIWMSNRLPIGGGDRGVDSVTVCWRSALVRRMIENVLPRDFPSSGKPLREKEFEHVNSWYD